MSRRDCGFLTAMAVLFSIAAIALTWSAIDYSQAYEVEATQCQYVKHSTFAGFRGGLNGYVTTCWQVPELEPTRIDGPVTWCRSTQVATGFSCDTVMADLKEKYPITSPPTLFPCYKAISNYEKMFLTKPDLQAWKDKFSVGIFFLLDGLVAVSVWSLGGPSVKTKCD
jgi:hypothetical protein